MHHTMMFLRKDTNPFEIRFVIKIVFQIFLNFCLKFLPPSPAPNHVRSVPLFRNFLGAVLRFIISKLLFLPCLCKGAMKCHQAMRKHGAVKLIA